ncbi:prolyl hydroxylase family protein [Pseudoduganella violaceinigra]|uniref:prolyl hydroxylase family protein n=1 Tax=Pseudoduganella violaceinigra TaxID=246602 RepID=UPI000423F41A|nr:2OG-Fe(II) oxygenase [Pseudoduganella violaceinigra]
MKVEQLGLGIFTVDRFLSETECQHYIGMGEQMGYRPSEVNLPAGSVRREDIRNNDRVIVDNPRLAEFLFQRAMPVLPPDIGQWRLHGLNERFRFYRYGPGEYFKWHKDGSFEKSGDEVSLLTFLIYLNADFEGGDTQFRWDTVRPQEGRLLVFPHKQSHQGAEIIAGTKYVLRSDVMYRNDCGPSN